MIDLGEYDARKTVPSSDEANDRVFAKSRKLSGELREMSDAEFKRLISPSQLAAVPLCM